MQLCNLLSLLPLFALCAAASRVVPCSRRSLLAGGLHLPSFSRFALVDSDPTQAKGDTLAACELSRELLVRVLDPVKMQKLSSPLPTDFFERRSAMAADCGASDIYGKQIASALFEYEADCFRIMHAGTNCTLKLGLEEPWDKLFDTPFVWSAQGLQRCNPEVNISFGDFNANTSFQCAFCRNDSSKYIGDNTACASSAMVRLSVCTSEVWFNNATAAALDTFALCQSSKDCGALCYGYDEWNRTQEIVKDKGVVSLIRSSSLMHGRQKSSVLIALDSIKQFVLPFEEVVDICAKNTKCVDSSQVGGINVTTNICNRANIKAAQLGNDEQQKKVDGVCDNYVPVMKRLVQTAAVVLPKDYAWNTSKWCHEEELPTSCQAALLDYFQMCESSTFWDLCKRQDSYLHDPSQPGRGRIYDNCLASHLGYYFDKVTNVNSKCRDTKPFTKLSDRGGNRWDFHSISPPNSTLVETEISWEDMCVIPVQIGIAYGIVSGALYAIIGGTMIYVHFKKCKPPWCTAADMTTDICRDRFFTTIGITWLLYSFYTLLTEYFVNWTSGAFRTVQAAGVPATFYLLGLSISWLPHFVCLFIANNPFRGLFGYIVTGLALVGQHCVAGTIIYLKYLQLTHSGDVYLVRHVAYIEFCICGGFCILMDIAYVNVCLGFYAHVFKNSRRYAHRYGSSRSLGFFDKFKESCLKHTAQSLNLTTNIPRELSDATPLPKSVNPSIALRAVLHVAIKEGPLPSHAKMANYLCQTLFRSAVHPRRFVVTSIKRVLGTAEAGGGEGERLCSLAARYHPDLYDLKGSQEGVKVLTLRNLEHPHWNGVPYYMSTCRRKRKLGPSTMVVEVSLLICGSCDSLSEKKLLFDFVEAERNRLLELQDEQGFAEIDRKLADLRQTIPVIDDSLIERLIANLNCPFLQDVLQKSSRHHNHESLTLERLEMLLGRATFRALSQTICFKFSQSKDRATKEARQVFVEVCTACGLVLEHAEILSCLPQQEMLTLQSRLVLLHNGGYNNISINSDMSSGPPPLIQSRASFRGVEHLNRLHDMTSGEVSKLFTEARALLLDQLLDPNFRRWVRANRDWILKHGGPCSKTHGLTEGSEIASPDPAFPIRAVFAFYDEIAETFSFRRSVSRLENSAILHQLIALCNSQNSPTAIEMEKDRGWEVPSLETREPLELDVDNPSCILFRKTAVGGRTTPHQLLDKQGKGPVQEDTAAVRRKHVLKKLRLMVYRCITVHNNPTVLKRKVKCFGRCQNISGAVSLPASQLISSFSMDCVLVLSVVEWMPKTSYAKRQASSFVVMPPQEHEKKLAVDKLHSHRASFVPTIVFISCVLTMFVICRTFAVNMVTLKEQVDWLMSVVAWVRSMCDKVQVVGNIGAAVFTCATPAKLETLMNGNHGELERNLRDILTLGSRQGQVFERAQSTVMQVTQQVDFVALEGDLELINGILVKVSDLQDASSQVPPDLALLQQKAGEIDSDVKAVQGSIERIQKTAKIVQESKDDIVAIVKVTQDVQGALVKFQAAAQPILSMFNCTQEALAGTNWTALTKWYTGDLPRNEWHDLFLEADLDHGGTLNISEYQYNLQKQNSSQNSAAMTDQFARIDLDRSGMLSENEWMAYRNSGGAVSEAPVDSSQVSSVSLQSLPIEDHAALQSRCNTFLRKYKCQKELFDFFPRARDTRLQVENQVLAPVENEHTLGLGPLQIEADAALVEACALYKRVGCEAPSMEYLLVDNAIEWENWLLQVRDSERLLNNTLKSIRENCDKAQRYTENTFLPSIILGNLLALLSSTYLTRRLIIQFKWSVQQVRAGLPAGKNMMDVKRRNEITSIEIPKFVGMTLMSFWFNYNIVTYLTGGIISLLFGPWLSALSVQFGLYNIALEIALVSIVVVVGIDMICGKKLLLEGRDELTHPIMWTWYATIMLLFNLAKGAALSTTRIMYLVVLNVCQFAIIDTSHFPEGFQGMDPAYSSFVALIYFTSKYRHPVITSLSLRSLSTTGAKQNSDAEAHHANSENPDDCRVRDNQGFKPASAAPRSTQNALVVFEAGSSTSVVEERPEPSMLRRRTDFSPDLPPQSLTLPPGRF